MQNVQHISKLQKKFLIGKVDKIKLNYGKLIDDMYLPKRNGNSKSVLHIVDCGTAVKEASIPSKSDNHNTSKLY